MMHRSAMALAVMLGIATSAAFADQQDWNDCSGQDAARAIAACSRIIADQGTSARDRADAHLYRGGTSLGQGDIERAIADYTEAILLAPENVVAHVSRALAYARKGDRALAAADYVAAERLDRGQVEELAAANPNVAAIAAIARAMPPPAAAAPPPTPPTPPAADACAAASTHWASTESIGTIAAYEDHLARFATCPFAGLARARIDALEQKAAAPPPVKCGPREVLQNGSCIAKACASGFVVDRDGDCVRQKLDKRKIAARRPARTRAAAPVASRTTEQLGNGNVLQVIPDPNLRRLIQDNLPFSPQ
jgi:hypothetical protein